jgi:hypothetical protein
MKNNNLTKKLAIVLLLGVVLLAPIAAFGVSTPYMQEINGVRTFEAYQNNAEDFRIVLQSGSQEPMNVRVTILEGSEVIELMADSNIFLVNPDEKLPVNFRILAPSGAQIGDSFHVRLGFASSDVGEGALAFGTAIEKGFDVLLVEMPVYAAPEASNEEISQAALFIFISIVVLLILLIIVIKVKRIQKARAMKNARNVKASEKKVPEKMKSSKKKAFPKKK